MRSTQNTIYIYPARASSVEDWRIDLEVKIQT